MTPSTGPWWSPQRLLAQFLGEEAAGGIVLMVAALLALVLANSPLADLYFALLQAGLAGWSVHHVVNDGLMAVFFLLVGLEIKREFVEGHLADGPSRLLPGLAALGGMAVPALVYVGVTHGDAQALRGWAIPAATDIAFALAVLALAGPRVPVSLKVFLAALAILDDLGAVVIIALFYTGQIDIMALGLAGLVVAALIGLNRAGVARLWPYLVLGVLLWALVLRSGVHATLAGVMVALLVPIRSDGAAGGSALHRLEHAIHPWVAFAVVPLFGFANAGVRLLGMSPAEMIGPVPVGIALGLLLGKQVGVMLAARVGVAVGLVALPEGVSWRQFYGVALLCGIGFTMSLFIGGLAFSPAAGLDNALKVGVLAGSLTSAVAGWLVLRGGSDR